MPKRNQTIRLLCLFQITLSLAMIFWGLVVEIRPFVLMDVVLTQEELQDDQLHDKTLAILQEATGFDSLLWVVAGGLNLIIGVACFRWAHITPSKNDL